MTPQQLTIFNATLRLGGSASILAADTLADTEYTKRPGVFAQALGQGKSKEMAKLIVAGKLNTALATMAAERKNGNESRDES